jgi:hypothetical protein
MKWVFSSLFAILALVLLVVGCPMMATAGGLYYLVDYSVRDWPVVEGTVTGLSTSESTDSSGFRSTTFCPEVEYTTLDGQTFNTTFNECSSPPAYQAGDTVEVYYDPANPRNVQLKGGIRQTLGTVFMVILAVAGGLLTLGGLVFGLVAAVAALRRSRTA